MLDKTINLSIPVKESILFSLKESKDEFSQELLYLSALMLYKRRKLSLGKAAELAGYNKIDFIFKLKTENEAVFDYNDDEIDEIFSASKQLP
jgi:predicted HTH domain antitoxin